MAYQPEERTFMSVGEALDFIGVFHTAHTILEEAKVALKSTGEYRLDLPSMEFAIDLFIIN